MKFLEEIFRGKPENFYVLVWCLDGKESYWFKKIEEAEAFAKGKVDVYFGVGLSKKDWGQHKRCETKSIAGLVALWADVDVAHDVHKKKDVLPYTYAGARRLIDTPEPTVIVDSGHGIQAWWFLEKPWIFADDKERDRASDICKRWSNTIRDRAKKIGFDTDSVGDLARIMRIPGTINGKEPLNNKPVLIKEHSGKRYTIEEMESHLTHSETAEMIFVESSNIVFCTEANPPTEKLETLKENDLKFRQTWTRTRKDFSDSSPSSYDMSLAMIAAKAGWTDQEIVNLLISSRRKHGDDLKRLDYYEKTIAKIQTTRKQTEAIHAITESAEDNTVDVLTNASTVLGIDIVRMVYFKSDPPGFRIETSSGDVQVGENLHDLCCVRRKFVQYVRHWLPDNLKQKDWQRVAQALTRVSVEEDLGSESTVVGALEGWLTSYLSNHQPAVGEEGVKIAQIECTPYDCGSEIVFFGPSFRRWLSLTQGERLTAKELGLMIRTYGGKPSKIWIDGTTKAIWTVRKK